MKRTPEQLIALGKEVKIAEVKASAARAMNRMASEYSPWEAIVWSELLKEAKQFQIDGTVGEYMLEEHGVGRKYTTPDELAAAIIVNADGMKTGRATIILARQAKIAEIEALTTLEAVNTYVTDI